MNVAITLRQMRNVAITLKSSTNEERSYHPQVDKFLDESEERSYHPQVFDK